LNAPSLPNCWALTFCGVRIFSWSVAPVRKLSYCEVVTCAAAEVAATIIRAKWIRLHFIPASQLLFSCSILRGLLEELGVDSRIQFDVLELGVARLLAILFVLMFVRHGEAVHGAP